MKISKVLKSLESIDDSKKLPDENIIDFIRDSIVSEFEAIKLYESIAKRTEDPIVKKVMLDVAREEIVHVGEFQKLLFYLNPDEKELYEKGYSEVEEMSNE